MGKMFNVKQGSSGIATWLAVGLIATATVVACEVIIRLATLTSANLREKIFVHDAEPPTVKDEVLGHRGNPRFREHDARGFRNARALKSAEIVAIGDSHTYGSSVPPDSIWTRHLSKRVGRNVYNMALGGYGPYEYERLVKNAAALSPQIVLVGVYFGNDFYDNWKRHLGDPSRYPVPEKLLSIAEARENASPLRAEAADLFRMGAGLKDKRGAFKAKHLLTRHSAFYGFLRAVKSEVYTSFGLQPGRQIGANFEAAVAALSPEQLNYASIFDGGTWRTIFTARYRFAVEDISDPRILVGRWMTSHAAQLILDESRANGFQVVFLLLPTKESVFAPKVLNSNRHPYFAQLVKDEAAHREALIAHFQKANAAYLDLTPVLRSAEKQPYFENADGHPNQLGHRIIAKTVAEALRSYLVEPSM